MSVRAGLARAVGVQAQGVVGDLEPFGLGHRLLARFDFRVVELFHPAAVQANHVVMVLALVEFVNGLAALEMVAVQQPRLFKLQKHPIDRGQANVSTFVEQVPEDVFSRHVTLHATLENFEDFQAGACGLEAAALEVVDVHGWVGFGSEQVTATKAVDRYNASMISACPQP